MTTFDTGLDIDGEVEESHNFERLANGAQHEEYLQLKGCAARTNGSAYGVYEAEITCPHVFDVTIAIHSATIEALRIDKVGASIERSDIGLALHPNFAVFTGETEETGFWVDDTDLRAHGHHS